jgi:signal transduction histidine kinase
MSLRSRVVLAAVSGVLVTLAIVLAVVLSTFATRERDALDAQLKATLRQAAARPADGGLTSAERASARLVRLADRSGIGVLATSADGRELARAGLAADYPAMHGEPRTSTPHDVLVEGRRLRVATRVGTFATEPARLTVIVPTAVVDDRIAALRTRVLAAGAGGVVLALLLSAGLTRIALRRLDRLRAEADALSTPGHGRLARGGPREIDELTRSLNAMLERLRAANAARDAALEASRRFAADAGHELRTPLTTMGTDLDTLARTGTLDAMQRELVADLDAEHERLRSLLEALQALARGDAPVTVKRQVVDVGELVDMAADAARTRHPRVDLRCTLDPSSHLDVIAWPEGLRLAFDNLLDNAARHGADRVSITAGAGRGRGRGHRRRRRTRDRTERTHTRVRALRPRTLGRWGRQRARARARAAAGATSRRLDLHHGLAGGRRPRPHAHPARRRPGHGILRDPFESPQKRRLMIGPGRGGSSFYLPRSNG